MPSQRKMIVTIEIEASATDDQAAELVEVVANRIRFRGKEPVIASSDGKLISVDGPLGAVGRFCIELQPDRTN